MNDDASVSSRELFRAVGDGDVRARNRIFEQLYDELKAIARHAMRVQGPEHVLQATALVHEAFLKLVRDSRLEFVNRDHFLATSARAMRGVLVDHARGAKRLKRNATGERVPLEDLFEALTRDGIDLVHLDEALEDLRKVDRRMVELVELRFFAGFGMERIADLLGAPLRSLEREWQLAKVWLQKTLR